MEGVPQPDPFSGTYNHQWVINHLVTVMILQDPPQASQDLPSETSKMEVHRCIPWRPDFHQEISQSHFR